MVVIEGIDRSTEAKRGDEAEGCSETIATAGAVAFDGGQWGCGFGERSKELVEMLATMKPKDDLGHEDSRRLQRS
jgi:hypothetical protein